MQDSKLKILMIAFAILFAGLGTYLLQNSHATSPATSFEAEKGNLSALATTGVDISASNGAYAQFGSGRGISNPAAVTAGFYPCDGNDPVTCFKSEAAMLNRTPSSLHVTLFTSSTDANTMAGNGWGAFVGNGTTFPYQWQTVSPHPNMTISVPLAFGGQSPSQSVGTSEMAAVANGTYDSQYTQLVNYAMGAGYTNITWRLGWEFDGNWFPWSSYNNPTEFVAAYRHVHDLIKSIMPASKFDWCGGGGISYHVNWAAAYPGDSYVDYIGADTYDFANDSTLAAFNRDILPGLQDQLSFAKTHSKQLSYPEWGLGTNDDTYFIQAMHDWFNSLPTSGGGSLGYNDYFNSNSGGASSLDNNPKSKALFITLFSK